MQMKRLQGHHQPKHKLNSRSQALSRMMADRHTPYPPQPQKETLSASPNIQLVTQVIT